MLKDVREETRAPPPRPHEETEELGEGGDAPHGVRGPQEGVAGDEAVGGPQPAVEGEGEGEARVEEVGGVAVAVVVAAAADAAERGEWRDVVEGEEGDGAPAHGARRPRVAAARRREVRETREPVGEDGREQRRHEAQVARPLPRGRDGPDARQVRHREEQAGQVGEEDVGVAQLPRVQHVRRARRHLARVRPGGVGRGSHRRGSRRRRRRGSRRRRRRGSRRRRRRSSGSSSSGSSRASR